MSANTYPTPDHGWTCFHCGAHFEPTHAGQKMARQHFGPTPVSQPACTFADRAMLIRCLRIAEARLEELDPEHKYYTPLVTIRDHLPTNSA